jgi:nitronate monooxygenase
MNDIKVSTEIDGMPQRVVVNELVRRLERGTGVGKLWNAFKSALAFRKMSGAGVPELLRSAIAMRKNERLTRAQVLMAANAPMLARKAMLEGDPVNGYLPGGTVAGVIDDRPSCRELIERIMEEAERTLKALAT